VNAPAKRCTRRYFLAAAGAGVAAPLVVPGLAMAAQAQPDLDWAQALEPLILWSAPGDGGEVLGSAAQWDYFRIARPQQGPRLYVVVVRSNNYAWVDASAVGASGPPPAGWPPPDLPLPPEDVGIGWVAVRVDAPLWIDPETWLPSGTVPAWTAFKQLAPQRGPRLRVQDPYSGSEAYLDAELAGPIEPPARIDVPGRWWGIAAANGANVRAQPSTRGLALGELPNGSPIVVSAWVEGEEVIADNPTWARLGDEAFVYSSLLRPVELPAPPVLPEDAPVESGRWIDLNLSHQVVVAYEGVDLVYMARTSTGRPGWETTPGRYAIQRRVEKETMESASLIGLDARRADYKVENVRWTQYFSRDGKALHENYWKPRDQFGIPSSHGCAGMVAEDAVFLWQWASIGTPVYVHY
jgi:hypothetical protein